MDDVTTYQIQVDTGPVHALSMATSLYVSAAAAVPAVLGFDSFPIRVKIWVAELQPDYPPLCYEIAEAGGRAMLDIKSTAICQLDDQSLLAAYQRTSGEPGDPEADALLAEIKRRELDL